MPIAYDKLIETDFIFWLIVVLNSRNEIGHSRIYLYCVRINTFSEFADILCLTAINIHQVSVDVRDLFFFCAEKLSDPSLFLTCSYYDKNCFLWLFYCQNVVQDYQLSLYKVQHYRKREETDFVERKFFLLSEDLTELVLAQN